MRPLLLRHHTSDSLSIYMVLMTNSTRRHPPTSTRCGSTRTGSERVHEGEPHAAARALALVVPSVVAHSRRSNRITSAARTEAAQCVCVDGNSGR